jgi:hypothetical protein
MRPRREIPGWLLAVLRPFFRYSKPRHAYVLRFGAGRRGPVLQPRTDAEPEVPVTQRTGRFSRDPATAEHQRERSGAAR